MSNGSKTAALALVLMGSIGGALAQQLPPGEARIVVLETCVQCHDLGPTVSQGKAAPAWARTVDEMIWRGAPMYPGERELMIDYLAQFFEKPSLSADPAAMAASDEEVGDLPPGKGRDILVAACVGCHDLETTVDERKSEAEWHHSVDLMVALGTRLSGLDQELLVGYLAANLGSEE